MVPKPYLPLFTFTLFFTITLFSFLSKVITAKQAPFNSKNSSSFGFLEQLKGSHKGDKMKGIDDLKKYLHNYGYLDRKNHIYSDDDFDEHLEEAVRVYQINFNLDPTGVLDEETISTMVKPRCGVADIINGTTSMRAAKHNYSEIPIRIRYKLPDGRPRWPKNSLTFGFLPTTKPESKSPIKTAFGIWQKSTHFKFNSSSNSQTADIRISFHGREWIPGDNPFDGPGKQLAHAFYPTQGGLHFDVEDRFSVGPRPGAYDYMSVTLHEIGHILGLDHTSVNAAVMYPILNQGVAYQALHPDDIQGIKALYMTWP